jgi:hypothetical protein
MADKKRPKAGKSNKHHPPKPLPPLQIVRREDDRHVVKYCWEPVLFDGDEGCDPPLKARDYDVPEGHEAYAKGALPDAEMSAGSGPIMYPRQVDPGELNYAIFNVQIQKLNGTYWLAKLLSTKTPVGGYPANTESWRFSIEVLTQHLAAATSLQMSGTQYDQSIVPLQTYWFPTQPGLNNELTMPTVTNYPPATHTANPGVLFEGPFATNFKMRLAFNLALNNKGFVTGTLTWFHNRPNWSGYLIKPGTAYFLQRVLAPQWPGQWFEHFYQSPP